MVAGYWRNDDIEKHSEPMEAEWDEVKYILTGQATFLDLNANINVQVTAGDMLWIPKGSRSVITSSRNLTAVYVEQTYRDIVDQNVVDSGSTCSSSKVPIERPSLIDVLARLQEQYVESNPKSRDAHAQACKHLPGGNTRSVLHMNPFPMSIASGRGCYVTSLDGRDYLDLVAEYTAGVLGHSHLAIQRAILNATAVGVHLGATNEYEIELAQHLTSRFKSIEKVRFCNSGTESNMLALAVAKHYTKRSNILVFRNGYHGSTLDFHEDNSPLNLPHDYILANYNDIQSVNAQISSESRSDSLAAILVEPMQAAGGMIPATKEFLAFLRRTADDTGAVLIFDEVVTSRLHFGGMQEYHGVYPDMTTLGKWIGGGFSFGAFGGREDIMTKLDPRTSPKEGGISHPGTFNNNVFSMAAGAAACTTLTAQKIQDVNVLGEDLRSRLRALLLLQGPRANRMILQVTGFGSLTGLHFSGPQAGTLRDVFFFHMLKRGIYVGKRGFLNLTIMHDQRHVDQVVDAAKEFAELYL
ncbi:hypothetical protein LTS17_004280 [Exophiala oligosperma]